MFGGFFGGPGGGDGVFEARYRCYPVSFCDKPELEGGDKVILPTSALDRLASLHIQYPMLFEITNANAGTRTHGGVMEFSAEEGMVFMPYWMMQNLLVQEGQVVKFRSASLRKGTFCKLQPHTSDFLDISDHKAVLETCLRNYSCLTRGDTIMIPYNGKNFYIDIKDTRPDEAICVIETDVQVDFEAPKDYKEPERKPPAAAVDDAAIAAALDAAKAANGAEAAEEPAAPSFTPFAGGGYKLGSGKKVEGVAPPPPPPSSTGAVAGSSGGPSREASTGAASVGGVKAGKVISGGLAGNRLAAMRAAAERRAAGGGAAAAAPAKEEKKEEEPKVKPFAGKGYSLKG
ncbi:unnamed protein product [Pedinophyceae sp. YPF-701]|nr:unnamed protein product [Pedinophyceae sp. YPF-701]